MIRVNYDPVTGAILSTIMMDAKSRPPVSAAYIDVASIPGPIDELRIEAGQIVTRTNLAEIRKPAAFEHIRIIASRIRGRFVTDMPGQEMLYLRKEAEARDWLLTQTGEHTLIEAEIGITGQDKDQVAQVYLNLAGLWAMVAAALEQIRLLAIAEVESATTTGDIDDALAAFEAGIAYLESQF